MPEEDQSRRPFDEQAALERLEGLKAELEESRKRRKDASAAFDAFVGSFRKRPDAVEPESRTATRTLAPRYDAPVQPAADQRARSKPLPLAGVLAGGAVAIAAGVILTRAWRPTPSESPVDSPVAVQSPTQAEPPGSAASPRGVGPDEAAPGGSATELVAVRDVWVRAIVDGERVVERELEAGTRVPLRGRTFVIRAGDAGAVRLTIAGRDRGPLGADGVVATRTYTAPPAAER
jgi:hypothetical protein